MISQKIYKLFTSIITYYKYISYDIHSIPIGRKLKSRIFCMQNIPYGHGGRICYNKRVGILQKERRKYFRHPISVPLRVRMTREESNFSSATRDISLGGLNFNWSRRLPKGSVIVLTIPVCEKTFDVRAKVAYTRESHVTSRYEIGVQFVDTPSAFRARLAEEVIQILEYRKKIARETGFEVTEEEAARQWVHDKAAVFPSLNSLAPSHPGANTKEGL